MARYCEIKPGEPVREPDHVLVVKHDDGTFEVSGTAGAGRPDARYLEPTTFDDKVDALVCAQDFADAHKLSQVYVKGFLVAPEKV
jgi:hypothetical protein